VSTEGRGGGRFKNFHFYKYFTSMRTHNCQSDGYFNTKLTRGVIILTFRPKWDTPSQLLTRNWHEVFSFRHSCRNETHRVSCNILLHWGVLIRHDCQSSSNDDNWLSIIVDWQLIFNHCQITFSIIVEWQLIINPPWVMMIDFKSPSNDNWLSFVIKWKLIVNHHWITSDRYLLSNDNWL